MDTPGSPTSVGTANGPPTGLPQGAANGPPPVQGSAVAPDYKGRIFGRSVLDVRFRAYYAEDLVLGELLVGADPEHSRRYLFRITDVAYGSESSDDGWAERTAGGLMAMDQAGERTDLRDLERRLYKVAKVSSLGYVGADGLFHKPKSLPAQFGEVTAPADDDLAFLRAQMGDIEIGRLRSGEDAIDLPVGIRGETLPSHVGVFATTGMGKSNLMKVLAGQVLAAHGRYALLLFDPHGEYLGGGGPPRKGLAQHPWAAERLRVYSPNARAGQASLLRLSLAELTVDDLRTAWKFSGPQSEALESAYALLGEAGTWLKRLAEEEPEDLKDAELGRHALATIQVLCRRARRIVRLPLMTEDPSQSLTGKVLGDLADGKVVLVDTSGLEAVEETLVASLLTRSLLAERADAYRADRDRFARLPRTLVALEEAQRVLTRLDDAEFNVFPRLAREGRKFNVGLCAVTQQPKLIDPELLSQFNTYFVLGLADERDRAILRSSSKQDLSDLGPEIQTLMPGEALVTNPEAPFALPTKVHYYEDWLRDVPEPEAARARPAGALQGFYD
jgi:DNA helicase HerA-like ATPase